MPKKVILDVDTGPDDAVAIIAALLAPELEVVGICSVNGNREVALTTDNTLRVKALMGADVPVYRGCEYPLVATLTPGRRPGIPRREGQIRPTGSRIQGDHLPFPATDLTEEPESAVTWLVDTLLHAEEKITLIPVGPLTNLAVALRAAPRIAEHIEEVVLMGGGHRVQNTTPMTEYNVWVDPEALEVVLQSGCKVTVVPLDATMECYLTQADADEIRGFGGPGAEAVAFLVDEWLRDYRDDPAMKGYPGVPVHDALAVCAAIDPSILTDLRPVCCHVDIAGGYADGQTCLDLRARLEKEGANCLFAFHADREKFAATLKKILKNG
ncbi:nucleoside hydrolase [Bittarella massiliensis (ex Durand et al. 2017)]|uniref:Nucleoside hydrolase n=2 Tax=Eubacteriales TaxID=186802 RepID=A0AAQ1RWB3_9FIRM|nr:nucleoside hydrolase [Bittarella massiliensis (ex Durand et al. 2017)]MZL70325.1 nucleoside hydrolase [Bittarella massiliensis (ex Durand et al. 2017)]MZL80909.1 nucleoside hydrolase [Bittarella massiliensis (ex Durand et al. 2017)]SHG18633.1 purine nucleosidase/pyrimidine-specific ribonucleoside hydrolase/ribosylpyrimidine nucleosidase [Bittarella massiliensis (ex Durand et al. 2017)]